MIHKYDFINKVLGARWVNRKANFSECDCYGLVILYYKEVLGIEVPCFGYHELEEFMLCYNISKEKWCKIDEPQDGCLFVAFTASNPTHAGIVIDNKALHSREGAGVRIDSLDAILRLYNKVEYYKYDNTNN